MILNFDARVAAEVGANAATIFHNICFWVYLNQKNRRNFYDGKHWFFNTKRAWAEFYPNMNESQVRFALDKLEDAEFIVSGNYNEDKFDRTKWYSIGPRGMEYFKDSIGENSPMTRANKVLLINNVELHDTENACARLNKPKNAHEVIEEAGKRHCVINEQQAQDFIDKFEAISEAGTWVSGKNVVTDWRRLITSGWVKAWQKDYRDSKASHAGGNQDSPADDRKTMDEFGAEIEAERRERGEV